MQPFQPRSHGEACSLGKSYFDDGQICSAGFLASCYIHTIISMTRLRLACKSRESRSHMYKEFAYEFDSHSLNRDLGSPDFRTLHVLLLTKEHLHLMIGNRGAGAQQTNRRKKI